MSDDLIQADDGLPARASGDWAQEKLYYVAKLMEIFATGQKHRWPLRAYIDLMAGPGLCKLREGGEQFDGSPLLALRTKTPFTHAIFVELNEEAAAALTTRTAGDTLRPRPTIITGNCNAAEVIQAIRTHIPGNALTLAFIDMLGLDVTYLTLRALTRDRKIDLAITLQLQDLARNLPAALEAGQDSRITAFLGVSDWPARLRPVPPGERVSAFVDLYLEQLRTLGYLHVHQRRAPMKNSKNAPLYRLLLASKHPRGAEFFAKIERIEYDGQRQLVME